MYRHLQVWFCLLVREGDLPDYIVSSKSIELLKYNILVAGINY